MFKLISSFLIFIQISFQVIAIQLTKQQEQNLPIFQPFPIVSIDPLTVCKEGLASSIASFNQKDNNYVAISLSSCGIFIYQITDLSKPILVFSNKLNKSGKTLGISISHQQKYVLVGHSSEQEPFKIIIEGNSNMNLFINKIIPWENNNDILFLVCNQQFQIFDWRQKENGIKFIKSVNLDTVNAKKIKFIKNNQYALVSTPFKGVLFYKVENGDDIDQIKFTYSCVLKPTYFDVSDFQIIDDDTIAVMMVYTGVFMHNMKNYFSQQGKTCSQGIFPLLAQTPAQGYGGNIYLSNDKKYLFTQYRTVGIKIYDVSNKKLQIIQEIKVQQNSKDIILNQQETVLFYSNSVSLQIFKRTKSNFNKELPNLLLNTYQLSSYNFFKESASGSYDFTCYWREDKQQLFIQRSSYGGLLLKYSGSGILEEMSRVYSQQSEFPIPEIQFLPDGILAYYPRLSAGFSIVDYSNPYNPIVLKEQVTMGATNVQFSFFKFFKKKPLGVVSNLQSALIFSIEDPLNPKIVGVVDTMAYTNGEVSLQSMYINNNEDTGFFLVSTYGVIVVDISNPSQPSFLSQLFTDGASDLKLTSNNKYALIAANYAGFIIAEYNSDKQLIFLSKTSVNGNCYKILQFEGDQYVIVTSYEDPTISLISISDIYNPRVLQRMGDSNLFGYYQICISQDKSELFVTGQYALYHLSIQAQITLHTQMYQLINKQNSNEYMRIDLEQGTSLKVGQIIELHLVPIYQTQSILIRKAYFYEEFVLQELPQWMNFYSNEKILRLDVSKQSLKKNVSGNFVETISQVVFLTFQALSKQSFVNNYLGINEDDSTSLYKACIQEGYIDSSGFIQENYNTNKEFTLGLKEEQYLAKWKQKIDLVKNFIQYTLNQNIINYTTHLKISPSLVVDLNNPNEYIQTLQNDISIQMVILETQNNEYIQSDKAKFVKKNYPGVLVLISDKQDEIKLEGSLKNNNIALNNGIKFSLDEKLTNYENIFIRITISDQVNYNYENILYWKDLPILSQQSIISIQPDQTLQKDFSEKYSKGEIYIQENFSYQISSNVFYSEDVPNLLYIASLKIGNEYKEIPKDYWLQFSQTDRVFTGIPTTKYYNDKIQIQVNATDGYSYKIDSFTIIPNQIPFNYAIQLAIQILGPLIGILGLYKYKYVFYNLLFKEQYVYSKDIAYVGEFYRKQIVITDNKRISALKLWNFFLTRVGSDSLKYQLVNEISKQVQINNQYLNTITDIQQSNLNFKNFSSFQEEVHKKIYSFGINQDDLQIIDKTIQNDLMFITQNIQLDQSKTIIYRTQTQFENMSEKSQQNTEKIQNQSHDQSYLHSQIKESQTSRDTFKHSSSKLKSAVQSLKKQITQSKQTIKKKENHSRQSYNYQQPIFKSDGQIDICKILEFIRIQQILLQNNKREVSDIELKQLENPTSIISLGIYCLMVQYLLDLCSTTKNIFLCLKTMSIGYFKEIDWYKAYVNIQPKFNEIQINPYPQITICENTLNSALKEIFQQIQKKNKITKLQQQNQVFFSKVLIEECLKALAIGISFEQNKYIQATRGESLHTYTHNIHSVRAFEKNNSIKCCYNIYEKLDIHYQQKGLTDNDRLPQWIQGIDLINGTILFGGIPQQKDIGTILIKVFHQDQYILRSFEIQILQKEHIQQQNIQRQNKQSFTMTNSKKENSTQFNYTDTQMIDSSFAFLTRNKSMDFTHKIRSRRSYDYSQQHQQIQKQNVGNATLNDEILEDSSEKESQSQDLNRQSTFETPKNKGFRIILYQNNQIETQTKTTETEIKQENKTIPDLSSQMCKVQNKLKLEQPIQDEESIGSIQD